MSHPVIRPSAPLLDKLDNVPHDGCWRTSHEMNEYFEYSSYGNLSGALLVLTNGGFLEERHDLTEDGSVERYWWRRCGD